jgi:hypothetical protein
MASSKLSRNSPERMAGGARDRASAALLAAPGVRLPTRPEMSAAA